MKTPLGTFAIAKAHSILGNGREKERTSLRSALEVELIEGG